MNGPVGLPSRAVRYTVAILMVALTGLTTWFLTRRELNEAQLNDCLGLTVRQLVKRLELEQADRSWVDEPPAILRGVRYRTSAGLTVIAYIAEGEPLHRKFNEQFEWDYEAVLDCRVGGIQYESGEIQIDVGPAVPFQFRSLHPRDRLR
jgi:hypothetical protein